MAEVTLSGPDVEWLLRLMEIDTVSPLEGGPDGGVQRCLDGLESGASERGFAVVHRSAPPLHFVHRSCVPQTVQRWATSSLLAQQQSLVLSWGDPQPPERRIVVNFHLDTVGPHVKPVLDGRTVRGRGAVDDKGPGVSAMVGVARAMRERPGLAQRVQVLVCAVPGEEGGAMGVFGTRWLVEQGFTGRLTLFAEPTGMRVMDACSASATLSVHVRGADSTDDHPDAGHNATLALGFLAGHLGAGLDDVARRTGSKVCIGGLRTGSSHNRVYGSGELLINLAYYDSGSADALCDAAEQLMRTAGAAFGERHGGHRIARRLVADWAEVVGSEWLKRDLPVLANRDATMERLLLDCGLPRHDGVADGTAFTCDAIWAGVGGGYTVVCGPGRLDENGAHTPDELVHLDQLDAYAARITDLVLRFDHHDDPWRENAWSTASASTT